MSRNADRAISRVVTWRKWRRSDCLSALAKAQQQSIGERGGRGMREIRPKSGQARTGRFQRGLQRLNTLQIVTS